MSVAKVFKTGGSQAIRIPKKYEIDADEVVINPLGDKLVITPRKNTKWIDLYHELKNLPKGDKIGEIEELPQQERDWSCFK